MKRLTVLSACCLVLGLSVAFARQPVHARLQTGDHDLMVDSICMNFGGPPNDTARTPGFGGPPNTEDTADLGLEEPQVVSWAVMFWKLDSVEQNPFRIDGPHEEQWYPFPVDGPSQIVFTRLPTGVAEPHGAALPRFSAAPNPFRGGTTIRSEAPLVGRLAGTVFDPAGRAVRRLESAGAGALSWDGRDDQGRRLDAGVYLVRVLAGDRSALVRLVLAD